MKLFTAMLVGLAIGSAVAVIVAANQAAVDPAPSMPAPAGRTGVRV